MSPTTIVVVKTSKDILAESLAQGISTKNGVALLWGREVSAQELFDLLDDPDEYPDIAVLVGPGSELIDCSGKLLARCPGVVVARVETDGEAVHMDMAQIDLDGLIHSLRGLHQQQVKLLPVVLTDQSPGKKYDGLRLAIKWLDNLLRHGVPDAQEDSDDVRGLSVGKGTIHNLLEKEHKKNRVDACREIDVSFKHLLTFLKETHPENDALAALVHGFELKPVELQALLICLGPELDAKYEKIYGFLHDDLGRRWASMSLLISLLGEPLETRKALAASQIFTLWRLFGASGSDLVRGEEPLRIDPVLAAWLLGDRHALLRKAILDGCIQDGPWAGAGWIDESTQAGFDENLINVLKPDGCGAQWLILTGTDAPGWRALLENVAEKAKAVLLRVKLAAFEGLDTGAVDEQLLRLAWATRLARATPVIDIHGGLPLPSQTAQQLVELFGGGPRPCIVIAPDILPLLDVLELEDLILLRRDIPEDTPPVQAFSKAGLAAGLTLDVQDTERLAVAYPLSLENISRAVRLAVAHGAKDVNSSKERAEVLAAACRDIASPGLPGFASALDPCFSLDDVVLPDDCKQQLNDIVAHVTFARKVLGQWGFGAQLPYGKGVAALFSGPSGTGKTMAARAIGHKLGRRVYAVDLSRVVSKYIGETEKNLDRVFVDAEQAGAVLLFDEADALFGKRSEVKDAHDRYANIETAYLLQRMEEFAGLAILTSNHGNNLDRSFLRRLRFVVDFPMPDVNKRMEIWQKYLPKTDHRADDIDFNFLARKIEVSGGNIRQIILNAAFAAASEVPEAKISKKHILRATRAELLKLGMAGLARELLPKAEEEKQ